MHTKGGLVTLRQVLEELPTNDLQWHVLDFEGVGTAPDGMTMEAFEHAVRAAPEGYSLSWDRLLMFADGIEQTWNCLIVGSQPNTVITAERIEAANFSGCCYMIQAFDSTEWSIGTTSQAEDDQLVASAER